MGTCTPAQQGGEKAHQEDLLNKGSDHCIDHLRQVLMCNADVSILTFRYRPGGKKGKEYWPNFNIIRTCRKWEPLVEWADAHKVGNYIPGGHNHDVNLAVPSDS
jgi:hypothetical protein